LGSQKLYAHLELHESRGQCSRATVDQQKMNIKESMNTIIEITKEENIKTKEKTRNKQNGSKYIPFLII